LIASAFPSAFGEFVPSADISDLTKAKVFTPGIKTPVFVRFSFFGTMPERDKALFGIADHIRLFWEPRMRRGILAPLDNPAACASMLPIAREALERARGELTPPVTV
jgi:formate dehydrogenase subunit delta